MIICFVNHTTCSINTIVCFTNIILYTDNANAWYMCTYSLSSPVEKNGVFLRKDPHFIARLRSFLSAKTITLILIQCTSSPSLELAMGSWVPGCCGSWVCSLLPKHKHTQRYHTRRATQRAPIPPTSARHGRIGDRIRHATPKVTIYQSEQLRMGAFRHVTWMATIYAAASHEATDEFLKIRHAGPTNHDIRQVQETDGFATESATQPPWLRYIRAGSYGRELFRHVTPMVTIFAARTNFLKFATRSHRPRYTPKRRCIYND